MALGGGPYSWWESQQFPNPGSPWTGTHPEAGNGSSVTLTLTGQAPAGPVLFQLPAFVSNIASASAGTVNQQTGTVTLAPTVHSVTVQLKHPAS